MENRLSESVFLPPMIYFVLISDVISDQDMGDSHFDADGMMLDDHGVVCIEEFDKMSDEDRVAIHELMEQHTVDIANSSI